VFGAFAAGTLPGVSFAYACLFLWAFLWRSFVVTLPLWFLGPAALFAVFPPALLSDPAAMLQPANTVGVLGRLLLLSSVLTLASVVLMAVAMRWTLRDFQRRAAHEVVQPPGRQEFPHIMD
jgi:hypothetical protein